MTLDDLRKIAVVSQSKIIAWAVQEIDRLQKEVADRESCSVILQDKLARSVQGRQNANDALDKTNELVRLLDKRIADLEAACRSCHQMALDRGGPNMASIRWTLEAVLSKKEEK